MSTLQVWGFIIFGIYILASVAAIEDTRKRTSHWGFPTIFTVVFGIIFVCMFTEATTNLINRITFLGTLKYVGEYLGIGIVWSFFKWRRFSLQKAKEYREDIKDGSIGINIKNYIPVVSNEMDQLSTWIFFWPLSVLRYVLGNILSDFAQWIVRRFRGVYEYFTVSAFKNLQNK